MTVRPGTRAGANGVTPAELREAERGLKLMLRQKFSAVWIRRNASDLLGKANVEYAEWLHKNPPADNPVGWLLVCAYRRALNLLDSETRRGPSTPLDSVFHLADESTPTPEQQLLDSDREKRLQTALGHLPEKERKLLALVYFGDLSIREAGRKLGWQKSAADRHHKAALEKLHALVGDRKLLSPATLGPAAWAAAYGDRHRLAAILDQIVTPGREAVALGAEGAGWANRQLGELARRSSPIGDHASAVASGGGGRLAGACGVALATVVCGLAATSSIVPAGGGEAIERAIPVGPQRPTRPDAEAKTEPQVAELVSREPIQSLVAGPPAAKRLSGDNESPSSESPPSNSNPVKKRPATRTNPPRATPQQANNEFGIEQPSEASAAAPEESAPSTSSGSSSSGSSSQEPAPSTSSGSSSGGGGTTPTPPSREFGL